jgi:hypothetical protein
MFQFYLVLLTVLLLLLFLLVFFVPAAIFSDVAAIPTAAYVFTAASVSNVSF